MVYSIIHELAKTWPCVQNREVEAERELRQSCRTNVRWWSVYEAHPGETLSREHASPREGWVARGGQYFVCVRERVAAGASRIRDVVDWARRQTSTRRVPGP